MVSIDALRGAAALAVVLYHATGGHLTTRMPLYSGTSWPLSALASVFAFTTSFGYTGVYLFFVISGFCIHFRWAWTKSNPNGPDVAFFPFWKRRIQRLYPPYLIALTAYAAVLVFRAQFKWTVFFAYDLGLHFLMLHNLDYRTSYSLNGVFWTLAIEEQLYLAYFALLWLRNRFGWRNALAVCFGARVLWFALAFGLHRVFNILCPVTEAAASHWFTWALGAIAVEAWLGQTRIPAIFMRFSSAVVLLATAATLAYADRFTGPQGNPHRLLWFLTDPLWGLGFFALLNSAVTAGREWRTRLHAPLFIKMLSGIGLFSYSLYLTHSFVLDNLDLSTMNLIALAPRFHPLVQVFIFTSISVLFAWLFFLAFEKRSMLAN